MVCNPGFGGEPAGVMLAGHTQVQHVSAGQVKVIHTENEPPNQEDEGRRKK